MKKPIVAAAVGGSAVLVVGYYAVNAVGYSFVNGQYEKIVKQKSQSKDELEALLSLYLKREIAVKDSLWGNRRALKKGARMIQYNILGFEPIDVVYNEADRVWWFFPRMSDDRRHSASRHPYPRVADCGSCPPYS